MYSNSFNTNQKTPPLLRLPAELQIKIWEYTLGGNRILPVSVYGEIYQSYHPPCKVYLRAETTENMRAFLILLAVCPQAYQEARLLVFSCSVCQLGFIWAWRQWVRVFEMMDEEQKNAITWISLGCDKYRQGCGKPALSLSAFHFIKPLKGLQVVIKRG
jgi:hypothetical protein